MIYFARMDKLEDWKKEIQLTKLKLKATKWKKIDNRLILDHSKIKLFNGN